MRRSRNCVFALLLGCCAPLLIWVGLGSVMYQKIKTKKIPDMALPNRACAVDSDCPPGFICVDGYCVPEKS